MIPVQVRGADNASDSCPKAAQFYRDCATSCDTMLDTIRENNVQAKRSKISSSAIEELDKSNDSASEDVEICDAAITTPSSSSIRFSDL